MASKTHCDVCDETPAKFSHGESVQIDAPNNMVKRVYVNVGFTKAAGYRAEDSSDSMDLCEKCRNAVLRKVLGPANYPELP